MHPVVLMSILDHHIRREAAGDKVIGALLGTVGPGGNTDERGRDGCAGGVAATPDDDEGSST